MERRGAYRKSKKAGKAARFVGFPKPRSIKRGGCRCKADNGEGTVKTDGKRVKLPVIGWVRMRELPRFDGEVRSAFVSERGGRRPATLTYAMPDKPPARRLRREERPRPERGEEYPRRAKLWRESA